MRQENKEKLLHQLKATAQKINGVIHLVEGVKKDLDILWKIAEDDNGYSDVTINDNPVRDIL